MSPVRNEEAFTKVIEGKGWIRSRERGLLVVNPLRQTSRSMSTFTKQHPEKEHQEEEACINSSGSSPASPVSTRILGLLPTRRNYGRERKPSFGTLRSMLPLLLCTVVCLLLSHVTAQDSITTGSSSSSNRLIFTVVPKVTDFEFFYETQAGCETEARELSLMLSKQQRDENTPTMEVECLYTGVPIIDPTSDLSIGQRQAVFLEEFLFGSNATEIHGLAVSVFDEELLHPIIVKAVATLNIPIITFDSDAPDSGRSYYIGTNNTFLGQQLARVMQTLRPDGGVFAILSDNSANNRARAKGIHSEIFHPSTYRGQWVELPDSPWESTTLSTEEMVQQMHYWAQQYKPDVIVAVAAPPMSAVFDEATNTTRYPWMEFVDQHREKGITLLCADDLQHQLVMLKSAYVNGLVGQMPYTMGQWSVRALFEMHQNPNATTLSMSDRDGIVQDDFIGTNVISHIHIPLVLPPIDVDHHLIGNLAYMGYTLFAIVAFFSLGFAAWAFYRRNVRVVRVAQPRFLIMIALGCLIFGSMMVPLGMDDGGGDRSNCSAVSTSDQPVDHCVAICMSLPWLGSIGFTIIFSALYSKTRRVNKIFKSTTDFGRVKVKESDVLMPFFILLGLNVVILICWSIIDPLTYVREADYARDGWNRVISTTGQCHADNQIWFLVCLGFVNGGVLLLANWQAFEARDIEAEFAETKYIGLCMASLLQAALIGVPVLAVVVDNPEALYTVSTLLIFLICMVVLLMMFVPKVLYTQQYMKMSRQEQKQFMAEVIGKTAKSSAEYKKRLSENTSDSKGKRTLSALSRPFTHISQLGRKISFRNARPPAMSSLSMSSQTGPTDAKSSVRQSANETADEVIPSSYPTELLSQQALESDAESENSENAHAPQESIETDSPPDDVLDERRSSGTESGMIFVRKSTVQLTPGFLRQLTGEANKNLGAPDHQQKRSQRKSLRTSRNRMSAMKHTFDSGDVIEEVSELDFAAAATGTEKEEEKTEIENNENKTER